MSRFIERYRAGEHEQVWRELHALGDAVRAEPLLSDAVAVARATMERARQNIEILIPRIEKMGYQFGFYEADSPVPGYDGAFTPPQTDITTTLDLLETVTGPLPLSLRAWYEIVGAVDFMGYHPEWRADYPDPLVVDPLRFEYCVSQYNDWREDCDDEGEEEIGPFEYEFAPDYYHKANVSGGAPYSIVLPSAGADARVHNEPHDTTFIDYIRICFRWGGFPGLEQRIGGVGSTEHIAYLTNGLMAL